MRSGKAGGLRLWHKLVLLVGIGLVCGLLAMAATAISYKNSLRTRINTVAQSIDSRRLTALQNAHDEKSVLAEEAYLKDKLLRIKSANRDIRFVYAMGRGADGNVYFLADSETKGSPGYSYFHEAYPEASPELRAIFDDGRLLVEGPSRDSYGVWLSALAPVIDDQSYRMTAVVGMDVPATTYGLVLGIAGGIPLALALLVAAFVIIRHRIARHRVAHAQFRAEMLSIASHELRTPLTGLRWSIESLVNNKLPAGKQHHALEIMYDSTLRLEESIEDIMQLAGLESGKAQHLYKKETDLREMMDDILSMQRLAADRRNISLTYSANWPKQLLVECDAQRMKRVFHNLISNAIKYSLADSVVTVGYGLSNDGGHIISIQDHGIGIPAAEQTKVWSGYYRASNTEQHTVQGTGFGLYLSRSIVEQHGGRIWFESEEGKGTTLFVELPDTSVPAADSPLQTAAS